MNEIDNERPRLETSFGGTVEKNVPDDVEWIDDAFYIKETRFGLFTSILREPLGQHFITAATEDAVDYSITLALKMFARWYITGLY